MPEEIDPSPARAPYDVVLRGRHVEIFRLRAEHAAELYGASHGPGHESLWAWLAEGPFPDEQSFAQAIALKAVSEDPFYFAIRVLAAGGLAAGGLAGHCALMRIACEHRSMEIGNILYTPALQRTVAGTEAMYLMARHAFEDLGVRRYEWKCNARNAPSYRAAQRYGFTFEGVFRQHMIVKGRNRDTAWFSMLDGEWPARRASLEAWLAPDNFDPEGRQRRALSDV